HREREDLRQALPGQGHGRDLGLQALAAARRTRLARHHLLEDRGPLGVLGLLVPRVDVAAEPRPGRREALLDLGVLRRALDRHLVGGLRADAARQEVALRVREVAPGLAQLDLVDARDLLEQALVVAAALREPALELLHDRALADRHRR